MTLSHKSPGSLAGREPWTRDRIKREILALRRRGIPLNTKSMQNHSAVFVHASQLFGSWEKAIRYCGIDYDTVRLRQKWTRRGILEWIRQRRRKRLDLRPGFVKQEHAGVFNAAVRECGGWYPAIRAAGIKDFEEVKLRKWDKPRIVKVLRRLGSEGSKTTVSDDDAGLVSAAVYHFGSWGKARKAAGFARKVPRKPYKWTRERILESIRGRAGAKKLGIRTFADLGGMSTAAIDMFGSWRNAVAAAGLTDVDWSRVPWKWPREAILKELQSRERTGNSLHASELSSGFVYAAVRTFGSLKNAILAAGCTVPERRLKWTVPFVIQALRALAQRGISPRASDLSSKVYAACRKVFGSLERAAQAAGLRVRDRAWKWPRERILEEIRALDKKGIPLTSQGGLYASAKKMFGNGKEAKRVARATENLGSGVPVTPG